MLSVNIAPPIDIVELFQPLIPLMGPYLALIIGILLGWALIEYLVYRLGVLIAGPVAARFLRPDESKYEGGGESYHDRVRGMTGQALRGGPRQSNVRVRVRGDHHAAPGAVRGGGGPMVRMRRSRRRGRNKRRL